MLLLIDATDSGCCLIVDLDVGSGKVLDFIIRTIHLCYKLFLLLHTGYPKCIIINYLNICTHINYA